MKARQQHLGKAFAAIFLAGGVMLILVNRPAVAEDLTTRQIIDGLRAPPTRSLSAPTPSTSADDRAFIARIRDQSRSLSTEDREHMAAITPARPKVDLDITFDYNSAALTPRAEPQLNNLGKALTSGDFADATIMLSGHTDANGSDDYNQKLSERRAETVKHFLVENYHIPAANLISAGYGKKGPKNPDDLFAAENRRVEIVNVEERNEASR